MDTPSPTPPLSRRSFLAAAAVGMAPLILTRPMTARGAPRRPANDRIGLGFIGVGKQSGYHLESFLKDDAVQVLAVCDVDTTRREHARKLADEAYASGAASGTYKGCAAFIDYHELLDHPGIDAVVIGTPDHWHAAHVIDSAKAGKDIYCEKPLSYTLAEAKMMMDAVRKNKRVLQTGSQQRTEYDGNFRTAVELVRNGRIGDIICVEVGIHAWDGAVTSKPCDLPEEPMEPGLDWDRWLGPAPKRPYNSILSPRGVHDNYPRWRTYREYSGGMITDWGAHMFDIAQWGLDMDTSGPVRVIPPAAQQLPYGAKLVYANGVEARHAGPTGVMFVGSTGWVYISREGMRVSDDKVKEPLPPDAKRLPAPKDHRSNWIECIRSREKPVCDVEVGARSVACCHLVNLAYWHGKALDWDPAKWEFPKDSEANQWRDYSRRSPYTLTKA